MLIDISGEVRNFKFDKKFGGLINLESKNKMKI
jgi:hypothetical protein